MITRVASPLTSNDSFDESSTARSVTSSKMGGTSKASSLTKEPHPLTTAIGRKRAMDCFGVDQVLQPTWKAFIPTFNKDPAKATHTIEDFQQIQRRLDVLGVESSAARFTIEGWIKQDQPFDLKFKTPGGRKMHVFQGQETNEGGDKVWASPPGLEKRFKDLQLLPRPPEVSRHRVITKIEDLYADDTGPFLFVGFGEGGDYRTSRASLDELAESGVTVIAVNLSKSHNAMNQISLGEPFKFSQNSTISEIPKGAFFHLDTVFRPLPHGALIFDKGMPDESTKLLEALYGAEKIIKVSSDEAFHFATNGRLIRKPNNQQVLFYKEGALSEATLKRIAEVEGGTLEEIEKEITKKDGTKGRYRIHIVVGESNEEVLRLVPLPTQEAWKGGGAVSCLTQAVVNKNGLAFLVMHPMNFKLGPKEAINEIERVMIGNVSPKKAWAEFEEFKARLINEGIGVIEIQPEGRPEAIFTRDGIDIFVATRDSSNDPLQTTFDHNGITKISVSNFKFESRKPEASRLANAAINCIVA